jgi:hypothetical protein
LLLEGEIERGHRNIQLIVVGEIPLQVGVYVEGVLLEALHQADDQEMQERVLDADVQACTHVKYRPLPPQGKYNFHSPICLQRTEV